MGKLFVCKSFTFEAAHFLPNHRGNCGAMHGHSYKLEVEVSGVIQKVGREKGMIVDFSQLKTYIQNEILDEWDHKLLNNMLENPTAENMVYYIVNKLKPMNGLGTKLERVRLWETATSYAEWVEENEISI